MKFIIGIVLLFFSLNFLHAQDFEGLRKINGTNIFLSITGQGETLVVLHGGPGLNHSYFKPHLNALNKKFRLVYYDQRASGKSNSPSPDSISIKFLMEDLDAIRKELKLEKLNLLAHSWGAVLATHYALSYPAHVDKIIFSNPAMLSREYDSAAVQLINNKTSKDDSTRRAQLMAGGNLSVEQYDELMHISFNASAYDRSSIKKINLNLPPDFINANRVLFTGLMKDEAAQANLYDSLKTFSFPVLIIHGESDAIPLPSIERLKNNIAGSTLVILNKSGHFPFVEEPETYVRIVTDFMLSKK